MNSTPYFGEDGESERICAELLLSVETKVRSAGRYVIPSDDLRPKTMEAARDHYSDRKSKRKVWKLFVALGIAIFVSAPVMERLERLQSRLASPTAEELNARAMKISRDKGIGANWGLMEVFSELRNSQAVRLGHSPTQNIAQ